jgi:hypothetical protein
MKRIFFIVFLSVFLISNNSHAKFGNLLNQIVNEIQKSTEIQKPTETQKSTETQNNQTNVSKGIQKKTEFSILDINKNTSILDIKEKIKKDSVLRFEKTKYIPISRYSLLSPIDLLTKDFTGLKKVKKNYEIIHDTFSEKDKKYGIKFEDFVSFITVLSSTNHKKFGYGAYGVIDIYFSKNTKKPILINSNINSKYLNEFLVLLTDKYGNPQKKIKSDSYEEVIEYYWEKNNDTVVLMSNKVEIIFGSNMREVSNLVHDQINKRENEIKEKVTESTIDFSFLEINKNTNILDAMEKIQKSKFKIDHESYLTGVFFRGVEDWHKLPGLENLNENYRLVRDTFSSDNLNDYLKDEKLIFSLYVNPPDSDGIFPYLSPRDIKSRLISPITYYFSNLSKKLLFIEIHIKEKYINDVSSQLVNKYGNPSAEVNSDEQSLAYFWTKEGDTMIFQKDPMSLRSNCNLEIIFNSNLKEFNHQIKNLMDKRHNKAKKKGISAF